MPSKSVRLSGTSVALPPSFRISSSSSSSPPCVRATATICAPAFARALAVAKPMPREAPVTRAMRLARGCIMEQFYPASSWRKPGPIRRDGCGLGGWLSHLLRTTEACGNGSWLPCAIAHQARTTNLASFREQRQLPRLRLGLGLVGEVRRIGTGKTVVREFWIGRIAAGLAHGAVHAVDRQEGK